MDTELYCVRLHGLAEGRHRYALCERGADLELDSEELEMAGGVELDLILDRTGSLLTARGSIAARAIMVCARCLEAFEQELTGSFDTFIRMGRDACRLEDEEDTTVILGDDRVSFAPSVREALILSLPMKPLCTPTCRGLCPGCGENLNTSACRCGTEPADPRWASLKNLRQENRGEQAHGRS